MVGCTDMFVKVGLLTAVAGKGAFIASLFSESTSFEAANFMLSGRKLSALYDG